MRGNSYATVIQMQDFEIFIPFEKTVSAEGELRLFGGIASSSSVDRDLERMDKAVLVKIADGLKKNSTVFFNHDTKGLGVGTVTSAEVRGDEVYINVVPTRAEGMKDVVTQIHEGLLKSFSIGGKILDYENEYDEKLKKTIRVIKDVDCYEVSVVGIPSNKDATILSYIAKLFKGDNLELKKDPLVHPGTELTKDPDPMANPGTTLSKDPDPGKPGQAAPAVGKESKMFKCAKCGHMNKLEDPAMGPGEDGKKAAELLDTPEFKKVFEEFGTRVDTLEKSYKAKLEENELALKAANARLEDLKKTIDTKVKSLETDEQAMQKQKEEEMKKADKGTFSVFPAGKAY